MAERRYSGTAGKRKLYADEKRRRILRGAKKRPFITKQDLAGPVKRKASPSKKTSVKKTVSKRAPEKARVKKTRATTTTPKTKSASQTFRKQMKEASRTKADKTPSYDFSKVTVPSSEELANQRKKQRLRRMAGSISPALVAAGGPGALLTRQGVKSLGGGKATVKTGKRIVDRLKQERKKRKGGYGYEQSYGEIVKKGVKGQRSSVKRKETLAEKEAKRQANLKKRRDAYKKRKKSRG